MKKNPRGVIALVVILTLISIFITLPPIEKINFDQSKILSKLNIQKKLEFRQGLDLKGGASLTFKADTSEVADTQREGALESARIVIERRVNLFGVSEPLIQTSRVGGEDRIIVEIPGISDARQAINLVGTTAKLSFWEQVASGAAKLSAKNLPLGMVELVGENVKETNLSGSDLSASSVGFDPNSGQPQVQLNFTSDGAKKFAEITSRNVGKPLAIILDNVVIQAPVVETAILTGDAVITGGYTFDQAKALSTQLNAGALPVPLSILEQHVVGPTLGVSSLQKSLIAGIIGLITIIVFMVVMYGRMGVIASFALLLYTIFVLSIFKLSSIAPYGITLTLAGIAGFILSIGMAVDANVLIFERIREELRNGKGKSAAIELGFSKAWTSIRDSNVSTLITCMILYSFGTGIIKGFALVLAIGVLISMFSAITLTRTFLRVFSKES